MIWGCPQWITAHSHLHAVVIDEAFLRQRSQRHFHRRSFLPFQTPQNETELISPIIPHSETVLLVLAVADFDAFEFMVKSEQSLGVDFLHADSLGGHAPFVFGPAKYEAARFQAQIAGNDVDRVHRIRVLFVSKMEKNYV